MSSIAIPNAIIQAIKFMDSLRSYKAFIFAAAFFSLLVLSPKKAEAQAQCTTWKVNYQDFGIRPPVNANGDWYRTPTEAALVLAEQIRPYYETGKVVFSCYGDPPGVLRSYTPAVRVSNVNTDQVEVEILQLKWVASCTPTWYRGDQRWYSLISACPNATITLTGPSGTRALLAGPVLRQTATVRQNGAPAAGKSVSISVQGAGGVSTASGVTNGAGQFQFAYIPPKGIGTVDTLTATCTDCSNIASKAINVTAVDPETCPRQEPGNAFGNPINPASGTKRETVQDYTASGPHP